MNQREWNLVVFCKQMYALVHALNWQDISLSQIKSYMTGLAQCWDQNKSSYSGTFCQVCDVVRWHLERICCPNTFSFCLRRRTNLDKPIYTVFSHVLWIWSILCSGPKACRPLLVSDIVLNGMHVIQNRIK